MQQHSISKRRRVFFRVLSYIMMTIAVIAISFICILLLFGYQFDFLKGTIQQGGLMQFRSFPASATINLDANPLSFKTPGKRTVTKGSHAVTMQLDGYREWSKTVNIAAGQVLWLDYTRFVPKSVTTSSVKDFATLADEKPSPDKKWFFLQPDQTQPSFTIADIRDPSDVQFSNLKLPANTYTVTAGQPQTFKIVEWDFGGRYLLIKHTNGDKVEFIRVDRTDAENTKNLSVQLGLNFSDMHFSGTSGNVYYGLESGNIRKLDSAAGTVSEPIVQNVTSFTLYKTATIAYIQAIDQKIIAGVYNNNKNFTVKTYDATTPILTEVSSYYNDTYTAVARGDKISIVKNADQTDKSQMKEFTFTLDKPVAWLQFSNNGRFVVAGNGTDFTTYDLETAQISVTTLDGTANDPTKPLQWLDDYNLVSTDNSNLLMSEFDGGNQQIVTDAVQGYSVSLSEDGKFLFSVSKNAAGGLSLQSSKMTTSN